MFIINEQQSRFRGPQGVVTHRHLHLDEWFLGLAGVASIAFVVAFLLVRTAEAGATFIWLSCYSGFSAICMLGLALRLRGLRASIHRMAQSAPR
ncbi:MAG TPA: hypothetical protein VHA33_21405 [Candidatus Angelobacter sp.]|nr:hypothetical protein [Candidatus Angelobacter sp.]